MLETYLTKKNSKSSYDPKVGEAAAANARIAERSMQFSEDFYNQYIAPLIIEQTAQTRDSRANENKLFDANLEDMSLNRERYKKYGIPAEDRYYKMVDEYSAPDEQEKQAGLALGDVRTAAAGQRAQLNRQLGSMGIDPTSPAAIAAATDAAVLNTAAEAGASTRARQAAKALGMQLTQDAANFGRGGQSSVLAFGQAASGNNQSAVGMGATTLGAVNQGAGVVQAGYGLGLKGYGQNLDAYTSLRQTQMQAKAQSSGGFGQLLGTAIGAYAGLR